MIEPPTSRRLALFEDAFTDGFRYLDEEVEGGPMTLEFRRHRGAELNVADGQVAIGGCRFPADRSLPAGRYAVECARATPHIEGRGGLQPLNCFARLVLTSEAPVRWSAAEGQVPLEGDGEPGFAVATSVRVESGAINFSEPGFDEALERAMREHDLYDFDELLERAEEGVIPYRVLAQDEALQSTRLGDRTSVVMQAGLGDGEYGVYVGYDAHGRPCRLLVDFGLVG